MKKFSKSLILLLSPLLGGITHADDLRLARIFDDHAVLQRNVEVPVWGWANPESEVIVSFADQTHTATSDAEGKWLVKLDPLQGSFEGRELGVTSGEASASIVDVVVGEVWHASGQSNMAGGTSSGPLKGIPRGDKALEEVNTGKIRYFNALINPSGVVQEDFNLSIKTDEKNSIYTPWKLASDGYGRNSAIAMFFAKELLRELQVPIGIIATPKGGASIQTFMSEDALRRVPEYDDARLRGQQGVIDYGSYTDSVIFKSRINPIIPYAIAGMIWYQGEANVGLGAHL